MRSCRGPSFADPADGGFAQLDATRFSSRSTAPLPASRESQQQSTTEHTGFQPIAAGKVEPTAQELATLVEDFLSAAADRQSNIVVFQGNGDPLEAASVVVDTVKLVSEKRDSVKFRLNTLGLCDTAAVDLLLSSSAFSSRSCISDVSVFLPAATEQMYAELLQPSAGRGFDDVCNFVRRCSAHEANVSVEVTAVDRPDVDVGAVEELARKLGASSFRTRSWVA